MRGLLVIIVLVFPIAELWSMVELARIFGWWLVLWFIVAAIAGGTVIIRERSRMGPRMRDMLQNGNVSLPTLLYTFRTLIAGILLVFPGVLSDLIAILLLIAPARAVAPDSGPQVIDGEFRKIDSGNEACGGKLPPD